MAARLLGLRLTQRFSRNSTKRETPEAPTATTSAGRGSTETVHSARQRNHRPILPGAVLRKQQTQGEEGEHTPPRRDANAPHRGFWGLGEHRDRQEGLLQERRAELHA